MAKGLTFTVIFEAQSLNYDEGFGNLSVLKKLRRGSGDVFTVASRQSLRYSIFMQGVRQFGWSPSEVRLSGEGDRQVTQHVSNILESEEVDLFGYMKTDVRADEGGKKTITVTRRAPMRVLPAISLEPFFNDVEMLTNKYQSDKIRGQPNIANMEQHRSLYRYTVAVDLNRLGNESDPIGTHISPNEKDFKATDPLFQTVERTIREISINEALRCNRVQQFLEVVKTLHRLIRGRVESLSPLFIVGGVYDCQNPFFMNAIRVMYEKGQPRIVLEPLKQILDAKYAYGQVMTERTVRENTYVGIRDGYFANSLEDLENALFPTSNNEPAEKQAAKLFPQPDKRALSPEGMIDKLKEAVAGFFNVNSGAHGQ